MVTLNPHFSPDWDDASVLLPESLLFKLSFPPESPRTPDKSIWVESMWMGIEEWRGREVVLPVALRLARLRSGGPRAWARLALEPLDIHEILRSP